MVGVAPDHLQGGRADGGAVLEVAAGLPAVAFRERQQRDGLGQGGEGFSRFRGNVAGLLRSGDGSGPAVDDDLVDVGVVGLPGAPREVVSADPDERVGQALGVLLAPWRRQRLVPGGPVLLVLAGERLCPRFRGNVAVAVVVVVVGMLEVAHGGPERLQHDRGLLGRELAAEGELVIVHPAPAQLSPRPDPGAIGVGDAAVGAGEPLQLPGRHREGHLGQVGLVVRVRDPGQRADLGVGEPGGGKLGPDQRQLRQGAGDPDMLAGGARRDLALP